MDSGVVGYNWLSSGGAYFIIAVVWVGSVVFFGNYTGRLGKRYDAPNDGCLLGVACFVTMLMGGAAGLLIAPYPWSLVASCVGAILVPALTCAMFERKMKSYRKRL